jgi:K+-sensing histidine kinase KdpD
VCALLLNNMLDVSIETVVYLPPVVASTLAGDGAGIVAALAAFFAFNYFFIEPRSRCWSNTRKIYWCWRCFWRRRWC